MNGGPLTPNSGLASQLYQAQLRREKAAEERAARGPDLIDHIDHAYGKVIEVTWRAVGPIVVPPFRLFLRCLPPVLVFVFLIFCHAPLWIAVLVAVGIGPIDILRSAGLVGPKRKDENGKEIDDIF
jgi:hypothetical protein